jgi:hypothetical protein
MKAGGIYRLNNRVPHKVKNDSSKWRVHLIIDYIRNEDYDRHSKDLSELDDRYLITTTSDVYWFRGPKNVL